MERELKDELEVPGHVVMTTVKSKTVEEWKQQAKEALDEAEEYGASCPNEMKKEQKDKLREALTALGQKCDF